MVISHSFLYVYQRVSTVYWPILIDIILYIFDDSDDWSPLVSLWECRLSSWACSFTRVLVAATCQVISRKYGHNMVQSPGCPKTIKHISSPRSSTAQNFSMFSILELGTSQKRCGSGWFIPMIFWENSQKTLFFLGAMTDFVLKAMTEMIWDHAITWGSSASAHARLLLSVP